jgi:hypothetical protein
MHKRKRVVSLHACRSPSQGNRISLLFLLILRPENELRLVVLSISRMSSKSSESDDHDEENDEDNDTEEESSSYSRQAKALPNEWKSHYNNLVWARDGNFPFWPSQIIDPLVVPPNIKQHITSHNFLGKRQIAYYYGSGDYGFIKPGGFLDYKTNYNKMSKQKVPKKYEKDFQKAIREAEKNVVKVVVLEEEDGDGDGDDNESMINYFQPDKAMKDDTLIDGGADDSSSEGHQPSEASSEAAGINDDDDLSIDESDISVGRRNQKPNKKRSKQESGSKSKVSSSSRKRNDQVKRLKRLHSESDDNDGEVRKVTDKKSAKSSSSSTQPRTKDQVKALDSSSSHADASLASKRKRSINIDDDSDDHLDKEKVVAKKKSSFATSVAKHTTSSSNQVAAEVDSQSSMSELIRYTS